LPAEDLAHVLAHTESLWERVNGKRIFVTGGTGFFGRWALESYASAYDRRRLNSQATVLTRRPDQFRRAAPALANHPAIELVAGDVRTFDFPPGEFEAVLHLATDADVGLIDRHPREIVDAIVDGTRRVLDFAKACGTQRLLYASSGAVYGQQPRDLSHIPEDYPGAPLIEAPRAAYAEAKRLAEVLCVLAHQKDGLGAVNARCFAFVGPLLQTGRGYAIGNFLGDALAGRPICVNSDGSAVRSYLYAADLAVWLWTLLLRGTPGTAYNVGSETEVNIAQAAREVASAFEPPIEVRIAAAPVPGHLPERYVPSVSRARNELGLRTHVEFPDAVKRTARWMRSAQ
jgi:dTDP-glucose 4,6-dehydratase